MSPQFLGVVLGDRGHIVFPVARTIHYTWLVIKYTLIKYTLTQVARNK